MDALLAQPSVGHLKRAISLLPKGSDGLEQVYNHAIERIEGQGSELRKLVQKVLAWLVYARRDLDITELRHAIAVEKGSKDMDENFAPEEGILDSVCAGLVTIESRCTLGRTEARQYPRLIHYTTQTFLERHDFLKDAETLLAETCLTYISYDIFEPGPRIFVDWQGHMDNASC